MMPLVFILNPAKKRKIRKRRTWTKKEQEKWLKSLPFSEEREKPSKKDRKFLKGIPFMRNVRRRKLMPVLDVSGSPRGRSRAWREVVRRLGLPRAARRVKRRKYARAVANELGIYEKRRMKMARRRVRRRFTRNDPDPGVRRYRRRRRSYASRSRWAALVKKYGVKRAATKYRRRRRYARNPANPWYDDRTGHCIAAYAGKARKGGFVISDYLKRKGIKKSAIRRYVKRHGLVLSHSKYLKRIEPQLQLFPLKPRAKGYAMNPAGIMAVTKDFTKAVMSKGFIFDGVAAFGGILGAVVGETIVYNIRKKKAGGEPLTPSAGMTFLGNFLGSVGTGIIVTIATKNMRRGFIAASGGLAYGLFKLTYSKIFGPTGLLKGSLFGMEIPPVMGDYVTVPETGDYVEIPAGQVSEAGQFIPEETGEFIPSEQAFGEEEIEY
jgi:hypothetical protein